MPEALPDCWRGTARQWQLLNGWCARIFSL
jgi:hypothetical protein